MKLIALDEQGTQQQRHKLPRVTFAWHASEYKVHKLHRKVHVLYRYCFVIVSDVSTGDVNNFKNLFISSYELPKTVQRYVFAVAMLLHYNQFTFTFFYFHLTTAVDLSAEAT